MMTAAQSTCQITFPVVLAGAAVSHEVHWTMFAAMLLEQAIMRVLRFKHGQVPPPPALPDTLRRPAADLLITFLEKVLKGLFLRQTDQLLPLTTGSSALARRALRPPCFIPVPP